ncbi:MAG: restriction endonuclease subunit S [Chloroflexota bacterium]|nr:restriction endonuclease subunit S [Chloroflexota bacterium]
MQESLIERLDEYRTALITQAVTTGLPREAAKSAGLDPEPSLKASGVDWLGQVPDHWAIVPLSRAVLLQRGHDLPGDQRELGDVPVVSSAGVSGHHSEAVATGPAIVTGRYGSIGDFYLIEGPFWPLNTTLYSIDMFGNDENFLYFLLTSLKPLFLANADKSAVPGVDRNDLHQIRVAIPPRREQLVIAEYLEAQSSRISFLREKAQLSIERLSEYRSALISAAVTGKIDVRDDAPPGGRGGA